MIARCDLESHNADRHRKETCSLCSQMIEVYALETHTQVPTCPLLCFECRVYLLALVFLFLICSLEVLQKTPPLFELRIVYSYVIEVADSESDLGLCKWSLIFEVFAFLRIRVTITIDNYSTT